MAWAGWIDPASRQVIPVARKGDAHGYLDQITIKADESPEGQGPVGRAIREGRPAYTDDLVTDDRTAPWSEQARRCGLHALAAAPIRVGNQVAGVLAVYASEVGAFREKQLNLLWELADDVSFALDKLESERALELSRAELAAIYDHAPLMMVLLDENRLVVRANQALFRFVGRPPDQILGRSAGDILGCAGALEAPGGCGAGKSCESCSLRQCLLDAFAHGRSHHRVETNPARIAGQEAPGRTLLASTAPVDVLGRRRVLVCLEDVTQSKQAEERIRDQAALLDIAQDAIFVCDLSGRIVYWNRGAAQVYGWDAAQAGGQDAAAMLFAPPAEAWHLARAATLEKGEWSGEMRQITRTKGQIIVRSRWTRVNDREGRPKSILLVGTDVTEQKRLEAQFLRTQRMETIGALAGGIAHDLNNVLSPIMMATHFLGEVTQEPQTRQMLATLELSAKRGAGIIKQLLAFGRGTGVEHGLMQPRHLLSEMAKIAGETFPKDIRIHVETHGNTWAVEGDATQVHQILLNLCVNARDAMPAGGVLTMRLENRLLGPADLLARPGAKPGPYVVITIGDTGVGIPPEALGRIFDLYYSTKPEGSGLGLPTVQKIVREHGGFLEVASQPGKGTQFQVFLPASQSDAAPEPVSPAAPLVPQGSDEWVLVVDDEAAVRDVAQHTLEAARYHVLTAADGAEAVALFAQRSANISLVVMDLVMPLLDGKTALPVLRRLNPAVAVVLIGGSYDFLTDPTIAALKADALLQKPFTGVTLLETVSAALARRRG